MESPTKKVGRLSKFSSSLGLGRKNTKPRDLDLRGLEPEVSGRLQEDCEAPIRTIHPIAEESFIASTTFGPIRTTRRRPRRESTAVSSPSSTTVWVTHNFGNVFPRYGHMVNVVAGKSDEVFLFGGKKNHQMLDDFYRIDPGTTESINKVHRLGMLEVIPLKGIGMGPRGLCMGASVFYGNKLYCIKAHL